jgi:hypothetical protein
MRNKIVARAIPMRRNFEIPDLDPHLPYQPDKENSYFRRIMVCMIVVFATVIIICALLIMTARAADPGIGEHEEFSAWLFLTIVTPPGKPDIHAQLGEPSIEACWDDAKKFVAHGAPPSIPNVKAIMAACLVPEGPKT